MRLTIFWERMRSELGGRTVHQALEDGWEVKDVWRAVCAAMEVPASQR
jgi:hypothetical protein